MKTHLLIFTAIMGSAITVQSANLTPEEALQRFRASNSAKAPAKRVVNARHLETIGNIYVFSASDGFMLLPNEDAAPALLGYADSGTFDTESNPALQEWLDFYNQELEWLKTHQKSSATGRKVKSTRGEITPLLSTEWNQEYPYNILCPKVDGHETVTGCVATAMAQVMKYHNWPAKGKGTHSYFWRPGEEELTFDYENTPFQWDKMTDRYGKESSEESRHAVAELMLGCGVSVNMHYEPGGSGAATSAMGASLIDIFDYSKALWMPNRIFYGYDEWESMIYADLEQGLPVLYSGEGTEGGHQFLCDGDKDGYFHFNWGWGGLSNGYFLLTALNPADLGVGGGAGGFNTSQIITLGVRPPKEGDKPVYIFCNTGEFLPLTSTVREGDDFSCGGLYFNYSLQVMPSGSRLGMKFENNTTGEVRYADGPGVEGYRDGDGRRDLRVRFPHLPDGTYTITPALHVDGEWSAVRMPVGYASEVVANVENGVARLSGASQSSIRISDVTVPSVIYSEREFPMEFTVSNPTEKEYYGRVTPWLEDSEGRIVAQSLFRPLDVLPDETQNVSDYIGKFAPLHDTTLQAGHYKMIFRDSFGKNVSMPVEVTVEIDSATPEIRFSDLRLAGGEDIADPESVKFTFDVECTEGYYFGAPHIDIFHDWGGWDIYSKSADRVYLTTGDSRTVDIDANLSHLADGWYDAVLYDGGKEVSGAIRFHIERSLGVETISSQDNGQVFDLQGRPASPDSPGIYIIDSTPTLIR
ncbi:MAG: C10 family peptidase [Muribaculaceae bacterium]|nr:C10 family peptidase [Muribaculaceae bacterium]